MKDASKVLKELGIDYSTLFSFESYCEGIIEYSELTVGVERVVVTFLAPNEPYNLLKVESFDMHLQDFEIFEIYTICDGQAYADRVMNFQHQNLLETVIN